MWKKFNFTESQHGTKVQHKLMGELIRREEKYKIEHIKRL
jgi:hypothetical protein